MSAYEQILREEPKTAWKKWLIALVILGLMVACAPLVIDFKFNPDGVIVARNILAFFFNPVWENLLSVEKGGILYLLFETVCIAVLGTLIGAFISFPLAFLSSRNITGNVLSSIGVTLITIIRTIPGLVYVLIFVQIETGAVAGILAFAVTSIGMLSKLFIEAIEQLNPGIVEALNSSGCNTFQKVRYGIWPQLKTNFYSNILYRFEINVKNATILGMVGAGGIGAELIFAMNFGRWQDAMTMIIGIIVLVLVIESLSGKLRDKLING